MSGRGKRRSGSARTEKSVRDALRSVNRSSRSSKIQGNEVLNNLLNRKLKDMGKFMQAYSNCGNFILHAQKEKITKFVGLNNVSNDQKLIQIEQIKRNKAKVLWKFLIFQRIEFGSNVVQMESSDFNSDALADIVGVQNNARNELNEDENEMSDELVMSQNDNDNDISVRTGQQGA